MVHGFLRLLNPEPQLKGFLLQRQTGSQQHFIRIPRTVADGKDADGRRDKAGRSLDALQSIVLKRQAFHADDAVEVILRRNRVVPVGGGIERVERQKLGRHGPDGGTEEVF